MTIGKRVPLEHEPASGTVHFQDKIQWRNSECRVTNALRPWVCVHEGVVMGDKIIVGVTFDRRTGFLICLMFGMCHVVVPDVLRSGPTRFKREGMPLFTQS